MFGLSALFRKGALSFRGGVHPPGMKGLTADNEIQVAELPSEVVIPLAQHIGWPSQPLVAAGDKVLKGQTIGEAGGFIRWRAA